MRVGAPAAKSLPAGCCVGADAVRAWKVVAVHGAGGGRARGTDGAVMRRSGNGPRWHGCRVRAQRGVQAGQAGDGFGTHSVAV